MHFVLCRHIRTNGLQCKAPALTEGTYCFFHNRLYQRHSGFRHTDQTRRYLISGQHIQLSALEDRESIQLNISVVLNALATGQLETKRATALLYGLQMASANAARLDFAPFPPEVVTEAEQTPDGLDLALPGATGHILSPAELQEEEDNYEPHPEDLEEYEPDQEEEEQEEEEQGAPFHPESHPQGSGSAPSSQTPLPTPLFDPPSSFPRDCSH